MTTRPQTSRSLYRRRPGAGALLGLVACGGGRHHLADYDFTDRSLGLVYLAPPSPTLYTGQHGVRASDDVVTAVARVGAGVAKEIEGRRSSARLDSATRRVDVADVLAKRTLERAARYLGL